MTSSSVRSPARVVVRVGTRLAIALAVGVAATAAGVWIPLLRLERGQGGRITTIYRGTDGWFNARDEVLGLRWSNLQRMEIPLNSPLDEGELPGWAEPPPPPYADTPMLRIGTLAAGWPLPAWRMRWVVSRLDQNFPMPAEVDDQDTSIVNAAEDAIRGTRAGGPSERGILWPGALGNTALFAALMLGFLALRDGMRRAKGA